jgi:hypothetical protein
MSSHEFGDVDEDDLGVGDDVSTENVTDLLLSIDNELIKTGQVTPELLETPELRGHGELPVESEIIAAEGLAEDQSGEWDVYTQQIRSALTLVGLSDPASVIKENLMELDQELLRKLDPYSAECLFFDVARKVHRQLGSYEPISWRRLVEQAEPKHRPVHDLDTLQLEQRIDSFSYLIDLGVDPIEVSEMVRTKNKEKDDVLSNPLTRQNVNRAAFCFQDEPHLRVLVGGLKKRANKNSDYSEVKPMGFVHAVRIGQTALRMQVERLEGKRVKQGKLPYDSPKLWDSVDDEVNKRKIRRMKASYSIFNLILSDRSGLIDL